jgi:hypothetical protein
MLIFGVEHNDASKCVVHLLVDDRMNVITMTVVPRDADKRASMQVAEDRRLLMCPAVARLNYALQPRLKWDFSPDSGNLVFYIILPLPRADEAPNEVQASFYAGLQSALEFYKMGMNALIPIAKGEQDELSQDDIKAEIKRMRTTVLQNLLGGLFDLLNRSQEGAGDEE